MIPIPNHLKKILVPRGEFKEGEILIGDLQCQCGNKTFQIMYLGHTHKYEDKLIPCTAEIDGNFFFLIKAICNECGKDHLLFDEHFHGWDGVMCHDAKESNLPRPPLIPWKCLSCGNLSHKVIIKIAFEDKEDFIEQSRGEFDESKWPDAFQWIWMTITCCKCGTETKDWVDYETA